VRVAHPFRAAAAAMGRPEGPRYAAPRLTRAHRVSGSANAYSVLPEASDANNTPPAVASTPLVSEPRKILKSQSVLPVSGSIALTPAEGDGSPALGATRPAAAVSRPMYWRPSSNGT